jgi:hypothetical protein
VLSRIVCLITYTKKSHFGFFCYSMRTLATILCCRMVSRSCRNYSSMVLKKGKISRCYRKGRNKKIYLQSRIVVSQSSGQANRSLMLWTDYKSISDFFGQIVNHCCAKLLYISSESVLLWFCVIRNSLGITSD